MLAVCLAGGLPLCRGLWQAAQAASPPVDAGLLEFLGSVDSDDADWHQYLAASRRVHRNPVDAPPSDAPAANPGASASPPPGSSGSSSPAPQDPPGASPPQGAGDGTSGSNRPSRPPQVNRT